MTTGVLACRLYGEVMDQEGDPLSYAKIVMLNPDGSESSLSATTSSMGIYHILSVPHGDRIFNVTRDPADDYRYDAVEIEVNIHELEQLQDITMQKVMLSGEMTDPRDGRTYATRIIGSHTWMAENLAWLPRVYESNAWSTSESRYYVYDFESDSVSAAKETDNYKTYGVLYNYIAAKYACPAGWHLPGGFEWNDICNYLGDENCGRHLKALSGWAERGGGDNSAHFNGLPGGSLDSHHFTALYYEGYFWTTVENVQHSISVRNLSYSEDRVRHVLYPKDAALSVRCIKN